MATAPAFIVHDGKLEITEDLESMGLREGSRLFLVSTSGDQIVLRREQPTYMGMPIEEYLAGWLSMRGIMQDGKDTTEERAREKADEAKREQRKFSA